jgi:hypothetical protein
MGRNLDLMKKMGAEYKAAIVEGSVMLLAEIASRATNAAPVATGELQSSLAVSLNHKLISRKKKGRRGRVLSRGNVQADLRALRPKLGDEVMANWLARHANIIEGGRRKDRRGRIIGSQQAPKGFVGIQLKRVRSIRVRIRKLGRVF